MSLHAMVAVLDAPPQREHSDRLVLIEFGNEAGSDGSDCYPGKQTIADNSGVSPRTVTDCIDRLEADGWVWVHHRGRGRVNHYVLLLPGLKELVPSAWSCKVCLGQAQAYRADVEAGRRSPYPPHAMPQMPADRTQTPRAARTEKQGDRRPTALVDNQGPATREVGRPASPTRATGVPKQGDPSPMTRTTRFDPNTLAATSGVGEEGGSSHHDLVAAIADACRLEQPLTATAGAAVGDVAKQLAAVGATPDAVAARAERLRTRWGTKAVTPHSLAKHWSSLADGGTAAARTPQHQLAAEAIGRSAALVGTPWGEVEDELLAGGHRTDAIDAARAAWDEASNRGAA